MTDKPTAPKSGMAADQDYLTVLIQENERLQTKVDLMARLMNDVLRVTRGNDGQVYALGLSHNSSVGLPAEFNALWDGTDD